MIMNQGRKPISGRPTSTHRSPDKKQQRSDLRQPDHKIMERDDMDYLR